MAFVFFERYLLIVTESSIPNVIINIFSPKQFFESFSSNVLTTKRKNPKCILKILLGKQFGNITRYSKELRVFEFSRFIEIKLINIYVRWNKLLVSITFHVFEGQI